MKSSRIVHSILGTQAYEALNKAITKLGTKSVVDITELHDALKIAPKSIIAFLMKEAKTMKKDEAKEIKLPWDQDATILINKKDEDVYAGNIAKAGKIVHEFSLCSIPQLAAHLLSFSEMYDEVPEQDESPKEESEKAPEQDSSLDGIKHQLKYLDDKINALMMLVASQNSPMAEMPKEEVKKSDIEPDLKKKFIDSVKKYKLAKGGLAPGMPKPPKPGSNVGGNQGITQAGMHSDKTAHTDVGGAPKTHESANPFLKAPKAPAAQPKQPKQPTLASSEKVPEKILTFQKSELVNNCTDCGEIASSCACFRALSKPEIKKSDSKSITFKFNGDWDQESISALYKSIRRIKD